MIYISGRYDADDDDGAGRTQRTRLETGVPRGVERGLQLLRRAVRVPRARGQGVPPDARELPRALQSCLGRCNGER